jgi:pimeloyl-ACP methyl ester carboxylesterase
MAWALGLLALLYAAAIAWLYWRQERLLFFPEPWPAEEPAVIHAADIHDVWIDVPGAKLHGLHLQRPGARGLVFYLHGNGGNAASWFVNADFYRQAGFDLFMLDYRGYGRSSGAIASEAQLMEDVRAAWRQLAPQYTGRPCVVFGRSLGTGLAAQLAAEVHPALTVLVSPYRSMQALAGEQYPWVPGWVLRYPLRTDAVLGQVGGQILLVHGEQDELIPRRHPEALLALAGPKARLLAVPRASHNDIQDFDVYLDGLRSELARL